MHFTSKKNGIGSCAGSPGNTSGEILSAHLIGPGQLIGLQRAVCQWRTQSGGGYEGPHPTTSRHISVAAVLQVKLFMVVLTAATKAFACAVEGWVERRHFYAYFPSLAVNEKMGNELLLACPLDIDDFIGSVVSGA